MIKEARKFIKFYLNKKISKISSEYTDPPRQVLIRVPRSASIVNTACQYCLSTNGSGCVGTNREEDPYLIQL